MLLSPQLQANVKQAEGLRLEAYVDTTGHWTVGYGHKLADGHDWTGYIVTSDYANALLIVDLNQALLDACSLPEWTRLGNAARQDAVTELVFNLGEDGWRQFNRTRGLLATQQWSAAANDLLSTLWAKQVGPARSNRIANQILTGTYASAVV